MNRLQANIAQVASTDAGREFFTWFADRCNHRRPSVVLSRIDDEVNVRATIINEALRAFYLEVSAMIPEADLIKIEFPIKTVLDEPKQKPENTQTEEDEQWQIWRSTDQQPEQEQMEEPAHRTRHRKV